MIVSADRRGVPTIELPRSGRIADIEILRAFAILYVVLHHTSDNLFKAGSFLGNFLVHDFGGWVGVDLFFAISGFVIARSLLPQLASVQGRARQSAILRFWGKRALRLMPSAWFWLAAILVLVVFYNESGIFGDLRTNLWATLAGVFNFANIRFADAFMQYPYGASFVYWSLSLEEQFYVMLPLLFLLCGRHLPWFLLAVALLQIVQMRNPWGMVFRCDAISLGVLLAILEQKPVYHRLRSQMDRVPPLLMGFIMLCLLAALPLLGALTQQEFPWQIGTLACLSAAVVFIASSDANYLAGLPGAKVFLWIGARSYAIYLIHIPAFFIVRETAHRLQWTLEEEVLLAFAGTMALILLLADLNYRLIETPAQRYGRRMLNKKKL